MLAWFRLKTNQDYKSSYFKLCKGLNWELEMHSLEWTKRYTLPWQDGKAPFDRLLSEHFGHDVAVKGLSEGFMPSLAAYKCAAQPWGALCGLTFTGCSLFSYHISLCFYSKSLLPSTDSRQGFTARKQVGWSRHLNEYKSGDQPVTEYWTAAFEDLTPIIIFACCIQSQFTELKGTGEAEWLLTLSPRGVWPEADLTWLFTACFRFVL